MVIRSLRGVAASLVLVGVLSACPKSTPSDSEVTGTTTTTTSDATTTTSTTTGTSIDASAADTVDSAADGTGCCEVHDGIGCDEAAVQTCVCDEAAECCTFGWDSACVERALACDATCMPDPDPTTSGADTGPITTTDPDTGPSDESTGAQSSNDGPCCEAAQSGTGCEDAAVTQCTCNLDPYCCEEFWDEICVAQASQACAIDCDNDCCTPHDAIACNDVEVFGCVADGNESCYEAWTQACVDAAQQACGLMCG
jgi:hypothetical protein